MTVADIVLQQQKRAHPLHNLESANRNRTVLNRSPALSVPIVGARTLAKLVEEQLVEKVKQHHQRQRAKVRITLVVLTARFHLFAVSESHRSQAFGTHTGLGEGTLGLYVVAFKQRPKSLEIIVPGHE